MRDWSQAKARQLIEQEIDRISQSQFPAGDLCEGMIQMAYALDLLGGEGLDHWQSALASAVAQRRQELRINRHSALLGEEVSRA